MTNFLVYWNGESEIDVTWKRDVILQQFENHIANYWR